MMPARFALLVAALSWGCSTPYAASDPEAPPPPPGATTPGTDGPLPAARGCEPNGAYRFCDDFDQGKIADGWSPTVSGSGQLAVDVADPVAARTSIGPGATSSVAALTKSLALTGGKARTELEVFVDADLAKVENASLVGMGVPTGEHTGVGILKGKIIVQIGDAEHTLRQIPLEPFPVGAWTHLVIEVDFAAAGRVFVSAGGRVLYDQRLVMRNPNTETSSFTFSAGVSGAQAVPVALRLDNVKLF